jgi:hypothetical protein
MGGQPTQKIASRGLIEPMRAHEGLPDPLPERNPSEAEFPVPRKFMLRTSCQRIAFPPPQ